METFTNHGRMLQLREELLAVEDERAMGKAGSTIEELDDYLILDES